MNERICQNCDYCGMDMDMDPYCAQPSVLKSHPFGLSLGSQKIMTLCPTPAHPLFMPRTERPFPPKK